jgi:lipopolysaccharide/colanic/teichoic acid biosynthesis glycosyltransferase
MTLRRLVDVVVAGAALAVLAPVFVVAALAVRLTSPGPVLFRQHRVGRGGRPFPLLKLRTMWDGSGGPRVTGALDARVTPVGTWLRRWKLDELPQLLNILRGDMTLIGPRPEVPEYLARIGSLGEQYAAIQPGLADAATLAFYDESDLLEHTPDPELFYVHVILPEKARLSVSYARARTLRSDLLLIYALTRRVAGLPASRTWALGDVTPGR